MNETHISDQKIHNFFVGLIMIGMNAYWVYQNAGLLYNYWYTEIMYIIKIPDWHLIVNAICGLTGIILGIGVMLNKLQRWKGFFVSIIISVIGFFIPLLFF